MHTTFAITALQEAANRYAAEYMDPQDFDKIPALLNIEVATTTDSTSGRMHWASIWLSVQNGRPNHKPARPMRGLLYHPEIAYLRNLLPLFDKAAPRTSDGLSVSIIAA